jgi:YHS domain-containing protein/thiol-disulfide isomerase/thioredoxin
MRHYWKLLTLILVSLLVVPAAAQQDAIHWHQDLESAKVVAKETKRLLLIHFWTPSCGPCMALERNVFIQPGVAAAIEAQFVPVKLNADENSATAEWYGISRVPTDVVATPDGQIIAKSVSPPTPAAYVAELTSAANKYAARLGQAYTTAASAAPVQSQLNSAYAKLPVSQSVPAALTSQATSSPQSASAGMPNSAPAARPMFGSPSPTATASVPAASPGFPTVPAPTAPVKPLVTQSMPNTVPAIPVAQSTPALAPPTATYPQRPASPVPQTMMNPALTANPALAAQPAITPVDAPAAPPAPVSNPYLAAAATAAPAQFAAQPPMSAQPPALPSMQSQPIMPANPAAVAATAPVSPVAPAMTNPAAPMENGVAAAASNSHQLPPGAPPLAFDGYCPVSMRNQWKWVPGNPQYGIVHLGRTYWFAGPEEQKQFWTDPTRYAPAMSGNDPVMAIDHQQQIEGKREHSLDYDGLFYMFASEATLQQFAANPAKYAAGVRQAMGLPRGRLVR